MFHLVIRRKSKEKLGKGYKTKYTTSYFAKYEVGNKFDLSRLNGTIKFDHGLLVERVDIVYPTFMR